MNTAVNRSSTLRTFLTLSVLVLSLLVQGGLASADSSGHNVGSAHQISGQTFDVSGALVKYTCSYVHRTVVAGGVQDKQSCTLAAGAKLPTQKVLLTYGSGSWASDYVIATTGSWSSVATSWTQEITPSGQDIITSFYATK